MSEKIIILKQTINGIVADTIINSEDTLKIDVTSEQTIIPPKEPIKVNTPGKDNFDYFVGIITVLGAIIAAIYTIKSIKKLFEKDEQKEQQISKLTGIAEKIQAQNEVLVEGNILLSEQIDVLRKLSLKPEGQSEAASELVAIEKQKFKLSILPKIKYDVSTGARSGLGTLTLPFINLGGTALSVINSPNNIDSSPLRLLTNTYPEVTKGQGFNLILRNIESDSVDKPYDFEITFKDEVGNNYKTIVRGTGLKFGQSPVEEVI